MPAPHRLRSAFRLAFLAGAVALVLPAAERPRVVVTTDAEIDDQCSVVRFLLYTNEWDVEGIITTSSQYRWQGHKWPGDHWIDPYLKAYAQVHPSLVRHDPAYPIPAYLRARTVMGNAAAEGDMAAPSPGSTLIVKALLDASDPRPVWLQAWGGVNTIARALKTIEDEHPERMAEVAAKARLFLIWEQDDTFQRYIRPVWSRQGLLTIISDQFEAIAYRWKQAQPPELHRYFEGPWMRAHILRDRGPLTALYHAHANGDFRSEGDSPAFLHTIPSGLRSLESPDWGGWGGRYVRVRDNTWLDPVPVPDYVHPPGRWFGNNGWGRASLRPGSTSTPEQRARYFEPMSRWSAALQNDFAARAAWCVLPYAAANHPPVVALAHPQDLSALPGARLTLSAQGTRDPDGHALTYRWWRDDDADTAAGTAEIAHAGRSETVVTLPPDALPGQTVHFIVEVTDSGTPPLTRYRRVVVTLARPAFAAPFPANAEGAVVVPPVTAHIPRVAAAGSSPVRVSLPSREGLDFADESFSLSFWLRWPRGLLPGGQLWLAKGQPPGGRYELAVSADSVRWVLSDGAANSTFCVSPAPFITGEWVHVAAVRDREERRLRLYADGRLLATTRPGNPDLDGSDQTGRLTNALPLVVGETGGELSELRFFRHALNANQVAGLAARARLVEQVPAAAPASLPGTPGNLPPLGAHLPLAEGKGAVLHEAVLGPAGALRNANPDTAWTSSDRGLALRLDGVDDRVEWEPAAGLGLAAGSFSVALHVRWTGRDAARTETILAQDAAENAPRWSVALSSAGLGFTLTDEGTLARLVVPATALRAGQWVHVVAVRDITDRRLSFYLDGKPQPAIRPEDSSFNGIDRTGNRPATGPLLLGAAANGGQAFAGELADVRIYHGALSASQAAMVSRLRRNAASNPAEGSQGAR
jgi:hypothetical protein